MFFIKIAEKIVIFGKNITGKYLCVLFLWNNRQIQVAVVASSCIYTVLSCVMSSGGSYHFFRIGTLIFIASQCNQIDIVSRLVSIPLLGNADSCRSERNGRRGRAIASTVSWSISSLSNISPIGIFQFPAERFRRVSVFVP